MCVFACLYVYVFRYKIDFLKFWGKQRYNEKSKVMQSVELFLKIPLDIKNTVSRLVHRLYFSPTNQRKRPDSKAPNRVALDIVLYFTPVHLNCQMLVSVAVRGQMQLLLCGLYLVGRADQPLGSAGLHGQAGLKSMLCACCPGPAPTLKQMSTAGAAAAATGELGGSFIKGLIRALAQEDPSQPLSTNCS